MQEYFAYIDECKDRRFDFDPNPKGAGGGLGSSFNKGW